MRSIERPKQTDARTSYYDKIAPSRLYPLWERLGGLLTPEPHNSSVPFAWSYEEARPALLEAAELISAEEAERRVLILENPGLEDVSAITETLYAGWQLIMPGEVAPAHRHAPSALRFLLEGTGAYTAVDGERAWMEPGDLVLTPSMRWHDHGHEGEDPVIWLDVLDLPLIINLGPIFLETFGHNRYPEKKPADASVAQFGSNMKPIGFDNADTNSPIIKYSYTRARDAVTALAKFQDPDPYFGYGLEYVDPTTGKPALATISTFLSFMPKGLNTEAHQSTEGRVFSIVEGEGTVRVGAGENAQNYSYKPRDTIVAPCWAPASWSPSSDTILFTASDRGVQQGLGIWKDNAGERS